MSYDFKTSVVAYQTHGDEAILERIYDYLDTDLHIETKRHVAADGTVTLLDESDPAKYIAYSIGAMMHRILKSGRYQHNLDEEDLYWYSKHLREFGYPPLTPDDNFAVLFDHYDEIREIMDNKAFLEMLYFVEQYQHYMRDLSALFAMERSALERALSSVDVSRSEREMVAYINRVFRTEIRRQQMERDGVVRLRTETGSVYVSPRYADPWRMIFESEAVGTERERIRESLTASQADLVDRIDSIISEDIRKGVRYLAKNYRVDEYGVVSMKNRYIAERLGMEESNLRKRLKAIRRKANFNGKS
jgi:hypothetical protein